MKNKNIIITGGSGFIGTHLSRQLLQQGYHVSVLDLVEPKIQHPNLRYLKGDIRVLSDLTQFITPQTDAVFHFAAIVSVPECELNPSGSFETNLAGTQKILDRIVELKSQKNISIFFASSAAVYGDLGKPGHQLREDEHLPKSNSFYGLHKSTSEQIIRLYCEKLGVRGLSFRFFNVHGPGQKVDSPYSGVITIFQRAFETSSEVKLFNYGNNSRDFIHVAEIARACSLALTLPNELLNGSPINLCTGKSILIKDVFKKMSENFGVQISTQSLPPREGDIQFSCGDPGRAAEILGFIADHNSDYGNAGLDRY